MYFTSPPLETDAATISDARCNSSFIFEGVFVVEVVCGPYFPPGLFN